MEPCSGDYLRLSAAGIRPCQAGGPVALVPPLLVDQEAVQAWTVGETLGAGDVLEYGELSFKKRIVPEENIRT